MTRALIILIFVMLAAAGYLIIANYQTTYKVLPGDLNHPPESEGYSLWRPFTAEDGSFAVSLPVLPQRAENHRKDEHTGEDRKYDMYAAEKNDGTVFVISKISSEHQGDFGVDAVLEEVRDDMVNSQVDNKLISATKSKFLGHDAMDVTIEHPKAQIEGKAFLDGKTLYLLMYVAPRNHYDRKEFDHFVESFQLAPGKAPVP